MEKERTYKTTDIDVRVAIWEAYNHMNSYAKDDLLSFREMEIDHIIPQDIFDHHHEILIELLKEFKLPPDFKKNCLQNYTPTRRLQNNQKGNNVIDDLVKMQMAHALEIASKKETLVLKKIEEYNQKRNSITAAANLAMNIHNTDDLNTVIDILLNETVDFETKEIILQSEFSSNHSEYFMKSTSKISIYGYLPKKYDPSLLCEL